MMSIEQAVTRFFADLAPARAGDTVLCALSGGPDSVTLFHLLRTVLPERGIALAALHLNHGLRGEQADRDEAFVRRLCERWQVPLIVERAEMRRRAWPAGESEESFARALRYDFFERAAARMEQERDGRSWVATAHTASDNAETLLFRLARGCEMTGAGGIPPVRGRYLRPLLTVTRAQILAYCGENGFDYVTDESNLQPCCSRNRLRLNVMPQLRQVNCRAEENLAAFAAQAREDAAFLGKLGAELLAQAADGAGWRCDRLVAAPAPVLRAALAGLLSGYGCADRGRIERCRQVIAGERAGAQLSDRLSARRSGGVFYLEEPQEPPPRWELPFFVGETTLPDGRKLVVRLREYEEIVKVCKQRKKELKIFADYGMINKISIFRTRRGGETFRPAGRGVTKSLKKLFCEEGIPRAQRDRLILLAAGDRVLWVEGLGFCEELLPSADCRRVAEIKLLESEE